MDTGRTALLLKDSLLIQGALSVKLIALLDKAERRVCLIEPDYCCFQVCPSLLFLAYVDVKVGGLQDNWRTKCVPCKVLLSSSIMSQA